MVLSSYNKRIRTLERKFNFYNEITMIVSIIKVKFLNTSLYPKMNDPLSYRETSLYHEGNSEVHCCKIISDN